MCGGFEEIGEVGGGKRRWSLFSLFWEVGEKVITGMDIWRVESWGGFGVESRRFILF